MNAGKITGLGVLVHRTLSLAGAAYDEAWEEIKLEFDRPLARQAARLALANAILAIATDESRDVAKLKWAAIESLNRMRPLSTAWIAHQQSLQAISDTRVAIALAQVGCDPSPAALGPPSSAAASCSDKPSPAQTRGGRSLQLQKKG